MNPKFYQQSSSSKSWRKKDVRGLSREKERSGCHPVVMEQQATKILENLKLLIWLFDNLFDCVI